MKGLLGLLRAVVVGFAVVEGARFLYRNKDRLAGRWQELGGVEGLKGHMGDLSVGRLLASAGPLKDLAGQFARLK